MPAAPSEPVDRAREQETLAEPVAHALSSAMLRFITQPSGPVSIVEFTAETVIVFTWADRWSRSTGITVDVNAVDNGTHGPNTLHGQSRAWDLDTDGDRPADLFGLHRYLRERLPPGYDVVLEADHVHVEWQPKR